MDITVFGIGGIGGYVAGKLGSLIEWQGEIKTSGPKLDSLSLIARGSHLQAIREKGLSFIDSGGHEHKVHPTAAADDFAEAAGSDVVFLCVKGYDLEKAVETIAPHVKDDTVIIPLLNGADIYERVRQELDRGVVLPSAIYISSAIIEPGKVEHKGGKGLVILGKGIGEDAVKPEGILSIFEDAAVPFEWHEDPFPSIWSKYLFISPFSLITAVSGKTFGGVMSEPKLKTDVRRMIEEVDAVARAKGVALPEDAVDATLKKAESFPPETKTSFQRDVEAGKKRDERDIFGGTVLRLGAELGVDTPVVKEYMESLP
ncbi:MAG: ketopantoate reductase family protein [Spirochaetia bacterium]